MQRGEIPSFDEAQYLSRMQAVMVWLNRVKAAFDEMKGSENTGGTENSRGLEHLYEHRREHG